MTMAAATSLETLLRATEPTVGSIWLSRDKGSPSWRAVITHGHSERDHPRRDAVSASVRHAYPPSSCPSGCGGRKRSVS